MILKLSHFVLVHNTPAPQVFIVGTTRYGKKLHWYGLRMLLLRNETWCPFTQWYSESCPIVNFRYFFIPITWREDFFHAIITGDVRFGFRDVFEVVENEMDVMDILQLKAEQAEEQYKNAIWATLLMVEKLTKAIKGEDLDLTPHEFTQPIYENAMQSIEKARSSITVTYHNPHIQ